MRSEKLSGHMKRVHPKGAKTNEERQIYEERRRMASGTAKWVVVAVIVVAIIIVAYFVITAVDIRGTNVGDKPPSFTLTDQGGFEYNLEDSLGKRPILLDFMSTTCSHCEAMSPIIENIHNTHGDKMDVLIIISNNEAKRSDVQTWVSENSITLPVLHDKGGEVFDQYDLTYFPSTFLIDKDGKIHWKDIGEHTQEELEKKIDEVL
jgi:peroxiredoxin